MDNNNCIKTAADLLCFIDNDNTFGHNDVKILTQVKMLQKHCKFDKQRVYNDPQDIFIDTNLPYKLTKLINKRTKTQKIYNISLKVEQ